MRKALKYIVIVVASFLWFLGCSTQTVVYLVDEGWIKDDYRYGDLYRLSNLKEFKEPSPKCDLPYDGEKAEIALYLAGDSFTEEGRVKADQYAAYTYFRTFVAEPDHQMEWVEGRKILVIETVERHFRERFSEKPWGNWQRADNKPVIIEKSIKDKLLDFRIPYREEMHESVLFSSGFFLWIKEAKAWFNHKILGHVDESVSILNGQLVYGLDVEPGISSVYDTVSEEEIDRIVRNANQTRLNYLGLGFDEVYLSVIPNKSSLILKNNDDYNHLLQRVENHPDLTIPLISVWEEFTSENYYQKGDSHWNCEGQKIWVDKVNALIKEIDR